MAENQNLTLRLRFLWYEKEENGDREAVGMDFGPRMFHRNPKLTHPELAKMLGTTKQTVSNMETV